MSEVVDLIGLRFGRLTVVERASNSKNDKARWKCIRKCNLRLATNQQNSFNSKIYSNNTSGTTGVSFSKSKNIWEAYININYKKINLGRFRNKQDAIEARKQAEEKYFGEWSYDNSQERSV